RAGRPPRPRPNVPSRARACGRARPRLRPARAAPRTAARRRRTESRVARGSQFAAATWMRAGAVGRAARSRTPACAPDFLQRPTFGPRARELVVRRLGRVLGCEELDEIKHFEACLAQQPEPIAVPERKLHLVRVPPLDPVQPTLGPLQ